MAKTPDPIDVEVGAKIKARRRLLGMSQDGLANILGVTFQQVQKYEKGTNRISSSRLAVVANAFGVPPSYFFPTEPGRIAVSYTHLDVYKRQVPMSAAAPIHVI